MPTIDRRRFLHLGAAAGALLVGTRASLAQDDYPNDKIRLLVPFGTGGGQDEFARRFIPLLPEPFGASIYVDNRPGGNGILATEMAVKSDPDGYTLLQHTVSFTVNPLLNKSLKFDPLADLAPISLVARTPHVLIARKDLPANTIEELVAYAKENPGKLNYGTGGVGSTNHIAALLFEKANGIEMEHIVYKSASEYNNDLLGGRIDLVFAGSASSAPLVSAGSVRAFGLTGDKRTALLPDVPTFVELGMPDVTIYSWTGYFAPAGTPDAIIDRLSTAMQTTCHDPEAQKLFPAHELVGTTPAEFRDFLVTDSERMSEILKNVSM